MLHNITSMYIFSLSLFSISAEHLLGTQETPHCMVSNQSQLTYFHCKRDRKAQSHGKAFNHSKLIYLKKTNNKAQCSNTNEEELLHTVNSQM